MLLEGIGGYIVGIMFMIWICSVCTILGLLLWGFITDREPEMPDFLKWIPARSENAGRTARSESAGCYKHSEEMIDFFVLVKVLIVGFFVSMVGLFLWPLYLVIGTMYALRFAYRERSLLNEVRKLRESNEVTHKVLPDGQLKAVGKIRIDLSGLNK